ncbi:MAG: vWA domain-containing protein [Pseudomonadales bacterium]
MIEFAWPWFFYALPLPLLALILPRAVRQEAALRTPNYRALSTLSADARIASKKWLQRWAALLMWLAIVLAGSQPKWVGEPISLPSSGRDLLLAVDISGSMGTEDMMLSNTMVPRLTAVKQVVGEFVERRKGDRLGLILFGSQAYLQAPLTFDRNTINTLLMETPLGIAGGKTAIGDAIGLAVKRLSKRPAENRVLILLTDGVNNIGEVAPLQAAKLAAQEGITIYTIGFGADQMSVSGLLFNRTINPSAELDTQTLTEIAELTGGLYQRARSTDELAQIYAALDELEPIEVDQETYRPEKSLFFWPLGSALLFSFLWAGFWIAPSIRLTAFKQTNSLSGAP